MKPCRILLADDHRIVREGLRLLINAQPDMTVVGEADNGREVVRLAGELQPEVVVMDLTMPELTGLQATQILKAKQPEIRVVALTVHEDEVYMRQVCQAGANGYVLKRSAADDLVQAIRTVMEKGVYYDPGLASKLLASQFGESTGKSDPPVCELSTREQEVLTLCAWGHSNKEIAAKLDISVKTVETYRARVSEKLQLRSRTEMVRYALRRGWLKEERLAPTTSCGE